MTPEFSPDPTDEVLFRFISEFAGWKDDAPADLRPAYLQSLDAFAQDVWPLVVKRKMSYAWAHTLQSIHTCDHPALFNADARVRCLALWHVCKGVWPRELDRSGGADGGA